MDPLEAMAKPTNDNHWVTIGITWRPRAKPTPTMSHSQKNNTQNMTWKVEAHIQPLAVKIWKKPIHCFLEHPCWFEVSNEISGNKTQCSGLQWSLPEVSSVVYLIF